MAVKVGINGFGRIGRLVFRVMAGRPNDFDVVADQRPGRPESPGPAAEVRHACTAGSTATVEAGEGTLIVNGKTIKILAEKEPAKLPWKELGVDVVVESTGFFTDREGGGKKGSASASPTTSRPAPRRSSSPRRPRTRTSPSSWASTTTS